MLACKNRVNVGACMVITMAQSQINITNLQLGELKEKGVTTHTRNVQGFKITFEVRLDDQRKPFCSSAIIEPDALPLVGFPDMLKTNFVVPFPKEKKAK